MMGATKKGEYYRTCEMLVDIAEEKGVFFAIALLLDSSYTAEHIKEILPILQKTRGAIK